MYDDYKAFGFTALAINLWQDWSIVRSYARQYTYPFFRDDGTAWSLYNINNSIPLNYVIDPDGIVRYGTTGFNESAIRAIIESYLPGVAERTTEFQPIKNVNFYPNPVNRKGGVKFDLTKAQSVKIRVFSSSGRLIKAIFNGRLPAGAKQFDWYLNDETGQLVSNGVYLLEIMTEQSRTQTKITVLR